MLKFTNELRQGGAKLETVKQLWDCIRRNPELLDKMFQDPTAKKFVASLLVFINKADK